ncbi:MAG: GDSL-type esterase/lipase family protein [Ilumatobacteraceae bacterium]
MRSRTWRVISVAALLSVLGSCSSDRAERSAPAAAEATVIAPPTTPPVRTVAVVGDSITNGSEMALREQLGVLDVDITVIDAEDGRRMVSDGMGGSGIQSLTMLASNPPDLWVIALGTNDVGQYEGAEGYAPVIDELIAAVPAEAPLVWVDVYVESSPDASAEFNATLRDELEERGNATIVNWADLAAEEGVLRDGIHPSGYGIEQFAEMVTRAVAQYTS